MKITFAPSTRTRFARSMLDNSLALYAGFVVLAAVTLAIFLFVTQRIQRYDDGRSIVKERQLLYQIYIDLLEAESGQRGYLLTSNNSYLVPYKMAIDRVAADFEHLSDVTDGTNGEQGEINALRGLADQKLTELRTSIELQEANKRDQALTLVNEDVGKTITDRIRASIDGLVIRQQQRLDTQFGVVQREGNALRLGSLAAVLFTVAVGWLSIRRLRGQLIEISSARDQLRDANTALVSEVAQRNKLEDQLRQSQKMEAIGQLAGGLAHDFNNMLTVVLSSVGLAKRALSREGGNPERYLDAATAGVQRAATLTHRLLAFSRQQPLSSQPIDPNKMVSEMAELLRRTLGENVMLETVLAGGLWRTNADPAELQSAILNLALNARDAMREGGKLTIETANAFLDEDYAARQVGVPAGQYVLVAVTDTGKGMTQDVVDRAFDPFFTTKPAGHGTGLGLSQVYGFVRQSGGHIKIYSEPGQGTTIKIYLARHYGEAAYPEPVFLTEPPRRGHETILIVEDEERVRLLTADMLTELGYRVIQSDGAAAALRLLDHNPQVDLLFTDVVMPRTNGKQLADEAAKLRPGLKVLFTTGYTRNAIVHNGVLDENVSLIVKPYSIEHLARKLREIFDPPPPDS